MGVEIVKVLLSFSSFFGERLTVCGGGGVPRPGLRVTLLPLLQPSAGRRHSLRLMHYLQALGKPDLSSTTEYAPRPLYDYYCIAPTPCPDHWSNLNKYQGTEPVNAQPQRGSAPQLGPYESPDQWRCPFLSPPNTRGGQRPICQSCLSRETRHDGVNIGLKL